MAHFGGLASVVENFGLVDGVSGGSSASISIFFYESMLANPVLWNCGTHHCSEEEVRPRLVFMLKSMMGAVDATIELAGGQEVVKSFGKSNAKNQKMEQVRDFLKNGFDNPGRGPLRRALVERIANRIVNGKLEEFEGESSLFLSPRSSGFLPIEGSGCTILSKRLVWNDTTTENQHHQFLCAQPRP